MQIAKFIKKQPLCQPDCVTTPSYQKMYKSLEKREKAHDTTSYFASFAYQNNILKNYLIREKKSICKKFSKTTKYT